MKKHYRKENDCLNCGTVLEGKFCHNCGQENLQIKESFGHMMNHAISDYFHFDQQFFHTLKPLLIKPGYLTNEYMAGRRAQYLHPVKMYIFISLVYFVLLFQNAHEKVTVKPLNPAKPVATRLKADSVNQQIAKNPNLSAAQKKQIQQQVTSYAGGIVKVTHTDDTDTAELRHGLFATKDTSYEQYLAEQQKLPANKRDGFLKMQIHKRVIVYNHKYGSRAKEVFFEEVKHNIPKMMFLMLPLFALILKITFFKNRKFYVEHLIYTFHLHCFLFIFLTFIMLLELIIPTDWSIIDWINLVSTAYITWYIFRSLRVVYNRSVFRTITKMIGMFIMYWFVFTFSVVVVLCITALLAA
ncbi:DUF3667 domain-containing protein [Mucilaginibacter sp. BJC16-A38]|uniref:DUF3667 domain-containing protein n=1 Tax=Mucilaginibacter phenanthrenivorans TaxID=1234842 RepID=UPI00215759AD|nr:DUF3667 domain-containing protein [Mucilaginibacter phenanthrenivorans]MCR8556850.1 DUF3667 domain-containing protein [Mucilaginibacter phenanthrenivorans]